jgi:lysozyme
VIAVCSVAAAYFLYSRGLLRFNYPATATYPVRGIDVSHHQGAIDWAAVRADGFEFAFIKSSEGADHVDSAFRRNWDAAGAAGLARGPYHFFTFCSPGRAQASHFASVAGESFGELPPVADVEFVGNCKSWTSIEQVRSELREFLVAIEAASGRRPAIYFTREAYDRILDGEFEEYATWPRSVFGEPRGESAPRWTFWQFADNGRVRGVRGLVDLDVFRGTRAQLESLERSRAGR